MVNFLKTITIVSLVILIPIFLPFALFFWAARYNDWFCETIMSDWMTYTGASILAVALQVVWMMLLSYFGFVPFFSAIG